MSSLGARNHRVSWKDKFWESKSHRDRGSDPKLHYLLVGDSGQVTLFMWPLVVASKMGINKSTYLTESIGD